MYTQRVNYGMTETYVGLSTDPKPTSADNGDSLVEIDTGKKFLFDKENGVWHEQPSEGGSGGGSGGSGGGSNIMVLHRDENATLDKTLREIITALKSGTVVLVTWVEEGEEYAETVYSEPVVRSENDMRIYTTSNAWYVSPTLDGYPFLVQT